MAKSAANQDNIKAAALYLLRYGLVSKSELTRLSGRSNQIIRIWEQQFPNARDERLKRLWKRSLARTKDR